MSLFGHMDLLRRHHSFKISPYFQVKYYMCLITSLINQRSVHNSWCHTCVCKCVYPIFYRFTILFQINSAHSFHSAISFILRDFHMRIGRVQKICYENIHLLRFASRRYERTQATQTKPASCIGHTLYTKRKRLQL